MSGMRVHWGGPDCPPGALRDLLEERIDAVPGGGEIRWVTYYFRDQGLASALIRARRRGVTVAVAADARPRLAAANEPVRRRLEAPEGLGAGFRSVGHDLPVHLHEKLYYFSHPRPAVLLGSFNPSGTTPEDETVVREIGDQDRGHNLLVEATLPRLVSGLAEHASAIHRKPHGLLERFDSEYNQSLETGDASVYFFPRRSNDVAIRLLREIGSGGSVRIAASHFRDMAVARTLCALARAGVRAEIIAHDTARRVPIRIENACRASGISFRRYVHPEGLPMHCKFALLEAGDVRRLLFGSMNLTRTSRFLNHEILAVSTDARLFAAFRERWDSMAAEEWLRPRT